MSQPQRLAWGGHVPPAQLKELNARALVKLIGWRKANLTFGLADGIDLRFL